MDTGVVFLTTFVSTLFTTVVCWMCGVLISRACYKRWRGGQDADHLTEDSSPVEQAMDVGDSVSPVSRSSAGRANERQGFESVLADPQLPERVRRSVESLADGAGADLARMLDAAEAQAAGAESQSSPTGPQKDKKNLRFERHGSQVQIESDSSAMPIAPPTAGFPMPPRDPSSPTMMMRHTGSSAAKMLEAAMAEGDASKQQQLGGDPAQEFALQQDAARGERGAAASSDVPLGSPKKASSGAVRLVHSGTTAAALLEAALQGDDEEQQPDPESSPQKQDKAQDEVPALEAIPKKKHKIAHTGTYAARAFADLEEGGAKGDEGGAS